jgi:ABC-type nickel/cobalt efflux system permease component RcnA
VVERFLKLVITLTLLLFLLQAVIGVLSQVIEAALLGAVSALGQASSLFGNLLAGVLVGCFAVGLIVRLVQFIATRDPRTARERAARERSVRQRVRRPAEGVPPALDQREYPPDPDPAVDQDEEQ